MVEGRRGEENDEDDSGCQRRDIPVEIVGLHVGFWDWRKSMDLKAGIEVLNMLRLTGFPLLYSVQPLH